LFDSAAEDQSIEPVYTALLAQTVLVAHCCLATCVDYDISTARIENTRRGNIGLLAAMSSG